MAVDLQAPPIPPVTPPSGFMNYKPPAVPQAPKAPTPAKAQATDATSVGYTAAPYTVDQKTGTVAGQLDSVLDKGGAYIRRAETEGLQKASERGLLNSSLSAGYARGAAIDRALPIAQADAGFFDKAMTNTANAENAERQFTAQQANAAALENAKNRTQISGLNATEANKLAGLELDAATRQNIAGIDADTRYQTSLVDAGAKLSLGELDANTRLSLGELDADTRYALGQLDAQTRERITRMDNNTKALLQTNASASEMYANTVKNISDLSRDPSLSPEAKQNAVDTQLNMLNQGLRQLQEVSTADTPQDVDLEDFFTKKAAISRMTPQQIDNERKRLMANLQSPHTSALEKKRLVDAINEFNSLVAEVQAPSNIKMLNLGEFTY